MMKQETDESFDSYVNRVKKEIVYCEYACPGDITSITRDQIVTGVLINSIRASALKNDWTLTDLIKNGRRIEASKYALGELGSDPPTKPSYNMKEEPVFKLNTSNYKDQKPRSRCIYCDMPKCKGGNQCIVSGQLVVIAKNPITLNLLASERRKAYHV